MNNKCAITFLLVNADQTFNFCGCVMNETLLCNVDFRHVNNGDYDD